MKIYKSSAFDVSGIDFCCKRMAVDVLLGAIKTTPWTDHGLCFKLGEQSIAYCPSCGAKVENILRQRKQGDESTKSE